MQLSLKISYLLLSVALYCANLTINGQNLHFSNLHENLYKTNPASITNVEKLSFQLTYRNQWPGNSDFVTYDGAFFLSSEQLKSSIGLYLLRDTQGGGIINLTGISLLYGYRTELSRDLIFSGGLLASYSNYSTNFSDLNFENNQIPQVQLDQSNYHINFATGVEFNYRENTRYGISVYNLGAIQSSQQTIQYISLSLSYSGKYQLTGGYGNEELVIEPLFYTTLNKDYNELLYGSRINYSSIYGGLYLRQNFKFQFDALVTLLGTRLGNIFVFYTYDINLSGVNSHFSNLAAHEVTFLYNMEYKRKSKKKGAIKCPKI